MVSKSSDSEEGPLPDSMPSSPPPEDELAVDFATKEEREMIELEERTRIENAQIEEAALKARQAGFSHERREPVAKGRGRGRPSAGGSGTTPSNFPGKTKKNIAETKAEKEEKARQLEALLSQTDAFAKILTKKTEVLGRVGSGFDGKALGEHELTMAEQPKNMVGGTMRPYQLEGLTWMYEICLQGMSGILADEMGLGKTIQTISLIALLRDQDQCLGPHIIVAPVSTLSNWIEEFEKWTPSVPVLLYHGTPEQRKTLLKTRLLNHLKNGRPDEKFPVICTSPEILMRDNSELSKINWLFIIIVSLNSCMKRMETNLSRTKDIE